MFTHTLAGGMMARNVAQPRGTVAPWISPPGKGPDMRTWAEVLVVDDEPDLRETVAEYLTRHGFAVNQRTANDGGASLLERRPISQSRYQHAERGRAYPRPPAIQHSDVCIMMLTAPPRSSTRGRAGDGCRRLSPNLSTCASFRRVRTLRPPRSGGGPPDGARAAAQHPPVRALAARSRCAQAD